MDEFPTVRHSSRGDGVGRGSRSLSPTRREMMPSIFDKRRDRFGGSTGDDGRDGRLKLLWQQPGRAVSLCLSGRMRLTGWPAYGAKYCVARSAYSDHFFLSLDAFHEGVE